MNTLQKWWQRFDAYLVPGVIVIFLLLGYQVGTVIESGRASKRAAMDIAQVSQGFTDRIAEKDRAIREKDALIRNKDRRLRKMQDLQLNNQAAQADAINSMAESTKIAAKAAAEAVKESKKE